MNNYSSLHPLQHAFTFRQTAKWEKFAFPCHVFGYHVIKSFLSFIYLIRQLEILRQQELANKLTKARKFSGRLAPISLFFFLDDV